MSERILSCQEIRNLYHRPVKPDPIIPIYTRAGGKNSRLESAVVTCAGRQISYQNPIGLYENPQEDKFIVILPTRKSLRIYKFPKASTLIQPNFVNST